MVGEGQNLYVGTSAHEILHLVAIPPTPGAAASPNPVYILASRIEPKSSTSAAAAAAAAVVAANPAGTGTATTGTTATDSQFIRQILVLPTVSKALVLSSSGLLTFYTLPEFSPAFNTKLKDVSYVGGLDLDDEDQQQQQQQSDGIPSLPEEAADGKAAGKLVMVHTRGKIRMIRVGQDARLVKVAVPFRHLRLRHRPPR